MGEVALTQELIFRKDYISEETLAAEVGQSKVKIIFELIFNTQNLKILHRYDKHIAWNDDIEKVLFDGKYTYDEL